ncbi:hypothetical protein KVT40_009265 [Elsinoe batatas]|uniref:RING-type domain-containing protein n=1 Tax=Elsinoe batatas TaxID=2601811 RepID=A0A8K0PDD0_9PEZI|nr:hypothetical protein KVT40_009265 [Elsinoe batatas]
MPRQRGPSDRLKAQVLLILQHPGHRFRCGAVKKDGSQCQCRISVPQMRALRRKLVEVCFSSGPLWAENTELIPQLATCGRHKRSRTPLKTVQKVHDSPTMTTTTTTTTTRKSKTTSNDRVEHASKRDTSENCGICLESIKADQDLSQCPSSCKKWLHALCILRWHIQRPEGATCPYCRGDWVKSKASGADAVKSEVSGESR